MSRHDLVQRVEQRRRSGGLQNSTERTSHPDRDEKRHAPAGVPGKQAPVPEDKPPTLVTRLLGDGREQTAGFLVGQREQRQFFMPINRGDDPRRPAAELSGPRVEQYRARERKRRLSRHLVGHSRDYATRADAAPWRYRSGST